MFKNVEELKEELRTAGMSNRSIDKLLATPIPDDRAQVRCGVSVLPSRFSKFQQHLAFLKNLKKTLRSSCK